MNAAPHTGSPLKQLRGWRIRAAFWHVCGNGDLQRAHTFQNAERMRHPWLCQEFMTKIKKEKLTQRDVKNEGCSQDVDENKGRKYMNSH
ncbi:MAG: hypothetical protein ABSF14_07225 [Terriglobia bacterium]|jgi:hypothetical protein